MTTTPAVPAVETLFLQRLPLARALARKTAIRIRRMDLFEDLEAAAMVGLFEAAGTFDSAKGAAFATHAGHRIRGAMLDAMRDMDHLSRVHRRLVRAESVVAPRIVSLSAPCRTKRTGRATTTGKTLGDYLADDRVAFTHSAELTESVNSYLACLDERSRIVVVGREIEGLTFIVIGKRIDCTPSRAFQIHRTAMAKMTKLTKHPSHTPTAKVDLLPSAMTAAKPIAAWECAACAAEYWPRPESCPCCHGATFTRLTQRPPADGRITSPDKLLRRRRRRKSKKAMA